MGIAYPGGGGRDGEARDLPPGAQMVPFESGHQVMLLAPISNLATRWRYLHQLLIGPPSGTTCIGTKFSHEVAPLALVPKLVTRLCHLHCCIALDCPIGIIS